MDENTELGRSTTNDNKIMYKFNDKYKIKFNHLLVSSDIYSFIFSLCPQIAKASLGGQCLFKTKYALMIIY